MSALLAYPNVSEGRDPAVIAAIADAFGPALIDRHTDPDHNRTAFTLAAAPAALLDALLAGAREVVDRIAIDTHDGVHPRVGALDVAPIIHRSEAERGPAAATALVLADRLAVELELPVLLYGELAGGRTRAQLRRGGPATLAERLAAGELHTDFGPPGLHPSAGAVLVAARGPLIAFNLQLAPPADEARARAIAAAIREGGPEGLIGVRAIGVWLAGPRRAQVSTNVEDAAATSLAQVVAAVRRHAEIDSAELVGLASAKALASLPADLVLHGRDTIEAALARQAATD